MVYNEEFSTVVELYKKDDDTCNSCTASKHSIVTGNKSQHSRI